MREPPTWTTAFFPRKEFWPDFAGAAILGTPLYPEADEWGVFGPIAVFIQSAVRYMRLMLLQGTPAAQIEIFDAIRSEPWHRFLDPAWFRPLANSDVRNRALLKLCRLVWGLVGFGREFKPISNELPVALQYLLYNLEGLDEDVCEDYLWQAQDLSSPPLDPDDYRYLRGMYWANLHTTKYHQSMALPPPQNQMYLSAVVDQKRTVGIQALAGTGVELPLRFIGRDHQVQRQLDLGCPPPEERPHLPWPDSHDLRFPDKAHSMEREDPVPEPRRPPPGPPKIPLYCTAIGQEREAAPLVSGQSSAAADSEVDPFSSISEDDLEPDSDADVLIESSHEEGASSEDDASATSATSRSPTPAGSASGRDSATSAGSASSEGDRSRHTSEGSLPSDHRD
jgi:hypothetical protein